VSRLPSDLEASQLPDREREICLRLAQVRRHHGLHQKAFAERLEVPLERLRSYEYAKAPIRYGLAERLCREFEISQRWLATGKGNEYRYFPIHENTAQFIPPKLLFSLVYDRLLEAFVSEKESTLASRRAENLTGIKIGYTTAQATGEAVTQQAANDITAFTATLRPSKGPQFLRALDAFLYEFKKEHQADVGPAFQLPPGIEEWKSIQEKVAANLLIKPREATNSPLVQKMIDWFDQQGKHALTGNTASSISLLPYENPKTSMQNITLAQRIKDARKTENLSQTAAAEKWEIGLGTLRDWEQGRAQPRGLYRDRIEDILGKIERKHGRG